MSFKLLLRTFRPSFLILTPVCIFLGVSTSLSTEIPENDFLIGIVLLGALSAHISVNTLNEYLDFKSGLDMQTIKTSFSGGSGTLPEHPELARHVFIIGIITLLITISIGVYLALQYGTHIIPYGLVGVLLILAYTRWLNRSPLLCLLAPGLGFGPLMIIGTYIILNGGNSPLPWLASMVPFFLVGNLLLLNQYPDIKADASVGRQTLPIVYGTKFSTFIYACFMLLAYALILLLSISGNFPRLSVIALIPFIFSLTSLYGAVKYSTDIGQHPQVLATNVAAALLTTLLLGISLIYG